MNDLGFNLCVAPWSLIMRLVTYFRVEGSRQNRDITNGHLLFVIGALIL